MLQAEQPTDPLSLVWLDLARPDTNGAATPAATPSELLDALVALTDLTFLTGGGEGAALSPEHLKGEQSDPDDADKAATGLAALGEIDDIAIVAMPDAVRFGTDAGAQDRGRPPDRALRASCATGSRIVDPPQDSSISEVREFRSQFDTKYAALYYPWVRDPRPDGQRRPRRRRRRCCSCRRPGSSPASTPAATSSAACTRRRPTRSSSASPGSCTNVTFDRQSVLNPEGINALRFFEGRSNRVWGARTMSSDPEWKYVNVRRLFIYLEHSIDKSTQWAVFEPNNERLWAIDPPDDRGLPAGHLAHRRADGRPSPRRRTSSAATAPR